MKIINNNSNNKFWKIFMKIKFNKNFQKNHQAILNKLAIKIFRPFAVRKVNIHLFIQRNIEF